MNYRYLNHDIHMGIYNHDYVELTYTSIQPLIRISVIIVSIHHHL